MNDIEFATKALDEAGVQVVPGSLMPGGEGLIRLSYGTSLEQIREGCKRLKEWLENQFQNGERYSLTSLLILNN